MSDEPKPDALTDDDRLPDAWEMPKPVFRTSQGVTPKNVRGNDDVEEDLHSTPNLDTSDVDFDAVYAPTANRVKVMVAEPRSVKRGIALSVMAIVVLIAVAAVAVILTVVYLFYSSPSTDSFSN